MKEMPQLPLIKLPKYLAGRNLVMIFSADWCPDCAVLKPVLPWLEKDFPQWEFQIVDVDTHRELIKQLEIFGIPSLVAFQSGTEVGQLVNKERKSLNELEQFMAQLPTVDVK